MIDLQIAVISRLIRNALANNWVGVVTASSSESFDPAGPQVTPEGTSPFDDALSETITAEFGQQALTALTFEDFSNLIAQVVETKKLSLLHDLPKVAQLLNRVRVDNNLPPL